MNNRLFLIMIILCGWMTTSASTRDHEPKYSVDVSHIPDAIPKLESHSHYGNLSYTMHGRHYHILKSAAGYKARGVASWYGMRFHHQLTASHEPYNLYIMTAAHRTLPLPSYVQVTNLRNGKKIIVKINDRGPFSGNRLIDLSYVAAKKLDMLKKGVAFVEVIGIDLHKKTIHKKIKKSDSCLSSEKRK